MKKIIVAILLVLFCGCSLIGYDVDIPISGPPRTLIADTATQDTIFRALATRLYGAEKHMALSGTIAGAEPYECVRVSDTTIVIVVLLGENIRIEFGSLSVVENVNISW